MARQFNGTDSYVEGSTQSVGMPVTLAAWFRMPNTTSLGPILQFGTAQDNVALLASGFTSGDPVAARSTAGTSTSQSVSGTGFSANTWHHGCAVFASATSRIAYIGGVAGAENTTSRSTGAASEVRSGRYLETNSTYTYSGLAIAHAAIWNVALTAVEVAALYSSGIGADPRSIRPDALIAYWPFLDSDSDRDWWGSNHLTATNAPTYAQHPPVLMKSKPTVVVMAGSSAPTISSVTVSGTRQIGQTLTASVATSPASVDSIAYQWEASSTGVGAGTDITGATASTLALTYDDFGPYLDTAAYVRCGAIATVGVSSSDETFSDWQTVTVPSGGAAGGSLLESSLIR